MILCFSRYFVKSKCDILIMFGLDQTMDDGKIIKNAPHIIQAIKCCFNVCLGLTLFTHHKNSLITSINFILCWKLYQHWFPRIFNLWYDE